MSITFGTSGFRGIIGDNWTKENVQKIGNAIKKIVEDNKEKVKILVGFDNRFMGKQSVDWFCDAVNCELAELIVFSVPVVTPVLAFKTASQFDYGIMITASHNPYYYNGIKVFLRNGTEASDDFFKVVVKNLPDKDKITTTRANPKYIDDISDYIDRVASLLDVDAIKKANLNICFNAMHGSGAQAVLSLFERFGVRYTALNTGRDAWFGTGAPAPSAANLKEQCEIIKNGKYNFGFAIDGDGDRISFIDGDGSIWECNHLMAVFYYYYAQIKDRKGTLVKSHVSSSLVGELCKKYGEEVINTGVGFKFLSPALAASTALIASEPAGIAFKDVSLIKDGIFPAFVLMEVIAKTKKSITELVNQIVKDVNFPSYMTEVPYTMEDLEAARKVITGGDLPELGFKVEEVVRLPEGFKLCFENGYWVAVRLSGTEPVARIYVEMRNEETAKEALKKLEDFYGLNK